MAEALKALVAALGHVATLAADVAPINVGHHLFEGIAFNAVWAT